MTYAHENSPFTYCWEVFVEAPGIELNDDSLDRVRVVRATTWSTPMRDFQPCNIRFARLDLPATLVTTLQNDRPLERSWLH